MEILIKVLRDSYDLQRKHPEKAAYWHLQKLREALKYAQINTKSKDIIKLEEERLEWSLKTFPDATSFSSLLKAEEEIEEIKADINQGIKRPEEYADALMCLFDSAGRQGISIESIFEAFAKKVEINKSREWKKNPDNTYSHV